MNGNSATKSEESRRLACVAEEGGPSARTLQLRRAFRRTLIVVLLVALSSSAFTYAWYIYNTNRHVTDVKMAAGTGVTFLVSDSYDGDYKTSSGLSFEGLLNPVSTDDIQNGFQRVSGFSGGTTASTIFASAFEAADRADYYSASLYLATNSLATDVYLSGIDFTDTDADNPISTALRVGFLIHSAGQNQPVVAQYIFELTGEHNPQGRYNTLNGSAGDVLDSTKTDGSTVTFAPLNSSNYCLYDETSGKITLQDASVMLCSLPAADAGAERSVPVQIDVYVWLEGCDEDCTSNLAKTNLESLALHFAGKRG